MAMKQEIRTHAAAARIKRVRVGGAIRVQPKVVNKDDHDRMQQLLKSISQGDLATAQWAARRKGLCDELHKLMNTYRLPQLESEHGTAEVYRPKGKASNTVDAKAFYERVSEDDFFECVKVSVTKAKEVLSGKELDEITDTVPGKLGEEVCIIKARGLPEDTK